MTCGRLAGECFNMNMYMYIIIHVHVHVPFKIKCVVSYDDRITIHKLKNVTSQISICCYLFALKSSGSLALVTLTENVDSFNKVCV